jgi:hypothetical protein
MLATGSSKIRNGESNNDRPSRSKRDPRDLACIRSYLATEIKPIEKAALLPTLAHIEVFSEALRAYNLDGDSPSDLHQILYQCSALATVKGDFFLGRQTEMRMIANHLKKIPIPLRDAHTMCLSPTTDNSLILLESCAWKLSRGKVFGLLSRSVPHKVTALTIYLTGVGSMPTPICFCGCNSSSLPSMQSNRPRPWVGRRRPWNT